MNTHSVHITYTDITPVSGCDAGQQKSTVYDVSLIILNKDMPPARVLQSLQRLHMIADSVTTTGNTVSPHTTVEIMLVDNGSRELPVNTILAQFPQVRIIMPSEPVNWAYALNLAVKEARGAIAVTLSSNIIIDSLDLNGLLQLFSYDNVFSVAPRVLAVGGNVDLTITALARQNKVLLSRPCTLKNHNGICLPQFHDDAAAKTVSTLFAPAGMAVYHREKFIALGGLQSIYASSVSMPFGSRDTLHDMLYWADIDISYRAWKAGWGTLYYPHAQLYMIGDMLLPSLWPIPPAITDRYTNINNMKKNNTHSLLDSYRQLQAKIHWRSSCYIFHWRNISSRSMLTQFERALQRLGSEGFRTFDWWESLSVQLARRRNNRFHDDRAPIVLQQYDDEEVFSIVSRLQPQPSPAQC